MTDTLHPVKTNDAQKLSLSLHLKYTLVLDVAMMFYKYFPCLRSYLML